MTSNDTPNTADLAWKLCKECNHSLSHLYQKTSEIVQETTEIVRMLQTTINKVAELNDRVKELERKKE